MIASDQHYNKYASFSWDGTRVVFLGSWRGRKNRRDTPENSPYFDKKGVHCMRSDGENEREIVSTKHYGSKFAATSPNSNWVAYVSWRGDSNRGLYAAPFDRLPDSNEIKSFIGNL